MEQVKVIIEPDVLITRIGALGQRDEREIKPDTIGLETRLRRLHALFNREASAAVSPEAPYDRKRELVLQIQEELLALAEAGYESEALAIASSGSYVGGLGMGGGFIRTYLDLIPPEQRGREYELRRRVEGEH